MIQFSISMELEGFVNIFHFLLIMLIYFSTELFLQNLIHDMNFQLRDQMRSTFHFFLRVQICFSIELTYISALSRGWGNFQSRRN